MSIQQMKKRIAALEDQSGISDELLDDKECKQLGVPAETTVKFFNEHFAEMMRTGGFGSIFDDIADHVLVQQ